MVESYGLAESSEGIHLRGFMTGRLRRLRGEAVPWQLYIKILAPYIIGAALGAVIGAQIQIHTLGFDAMPLVTDVRYGGACIGAVVGFFTLAPLAARYSGIALLGAAPSGRQGIASAGLVSTRTVTILAPSSFCPAIPKRL